jgi:hypothetical protein
MLIDSIIEHSKDENAVPKDNEYVVVNGKRNRLQNSDRWRFNIQRKDGTTRCKSPRTRKGVNPVEIAAYAVANKIASEPAVAWWVPLTIQKRDRIDCY